MSSKQTLREEAIRFRNSIDPMSEDMDEFVSEFFECLKPSAGQIVALYWPRGKEFDTGPLIESLIRAGFTCALPVMQKDSRELKFAEWNESVALVKGPFDVMQPEVNDKTKWVDPDIIVVPLLAFDRHGNRLGYGGGYYDVTLAAIRGRKEVKAVGIGYSLQAVLFNLPAEPHDQKMDWIITPGKVQRHI